MITLPVWQGLTGLGVVTSIVIAMTNINNAKLSKKVNKETFEEYKIADQQRHKDLDDKIGRIDKNVITLVSLQMGGKK